MLTLAINTSLPMESVVLLSQKKVLGEIQWRGEHDESKKLLPAISLLLKNTKVSFQNLQNIIIISGPGPFSALRIGVTVANLLAFSLQIPLFAIDTETLEKGKSQSSFGASLLRVKLSLLKKKKVVTPRYLRPPHITPRKHSYVP